MVKLFQHLLSSLPFRQRTKKSPTIGLTLTRAQARKLVVNSIGTELLKKGFNKKKGSTFWRVGEFKSDVVEVRFSTIFESQRAGIPPSSFSIWVGSYFGFVPNIYDEKLLHQIDDLLTPVEWICHIRFSVLRDTQNSKEASGSNWWCLTGSKTTDELELTNALSHISDTMLLLERTGALRGVLDFLESSELNSGLGNPESSQRNFLLGCAYFHANNSAMALECLRKAQMQLDEIIERILKAGAQITENSPLFKEQKIIKELIARVSV
jgi:hypothetical protein